MDNTLNEIPVMSGEEMRDILDLLSNNSNPDEDEYDPNDFKPAVIDVASDIPTPTSTTGMVGEAERRFETQLALERENEREHEREIEQEKRLKNETEKLISNASKQLEEIVTEFRAAAHERLYDFNKELEIHTRRAINHYRSMLSTRMNGMCLKWQRQLDIKLETGMMPETQQYTPQHQNDAKQSRYFRGTNTRGSPTKPEEYHPGKKGQYQYQYQYQPKRLPIETSPNYTPSHHRDTRVERSGWYTDDTLQYRHTNPNYPTTSGNYRPQNTYKYQQQQQYGYRTKDEWVRIQIQYVFTVSWPQKDLSDHLFPPNTA